jgi:hypothetical protein
VHSLSKQLRLRAILALIGLTTLNGTAQAQAPLASPPAAAEPSSTEPSNKSGEPEAAASEPRKDDVPAWAKHLNINGGVVLYFYQPTQSGLKNNIDIFYTNLLLDGKWGAFGLHLEPRFRYSKLRSFFEGPVWLQEAYVSANFEPITVKVGQTYKRLGLFWDNSFYGNVQVYDGLKLDTNLGISVEGKVGDKVGLDFWAQYFVLDGRTNVSLPGRDTISIPGARRRNSFVGRVEPFYQFSDEGAVQVGLSAESFTADLPEEAQGVTRLAVDAKLKIGGFGMWGEFLRQNGRHVTDFPYAGSPATGDAPAVPGRASGRNNYFLAGAEYTYWRLTARYNVSFADYSDVSVQEAMHVPAIGIVAHDNISVLGEYVIWTRNTNEGASIFDRSVNVTVNGHF